MLDHFGTEIADALVAELGIILQVWAARNIQRAARQALIHRQHKAEARDATFIAKCLVQRLAERQPGIFRVW